MVGKDRHLMVVLESVDAWKYIGVGHLGARDEEPEAVGRLAPCCSPPSTVPRSRQRVRSGLSTRTKLDALLRECKTARDWISFSGLSLSSRQASANEVVLRNVARFPATLACCEAS